MAYNEENIYIPKSLFKISKRRLILQYLKWLPYQLGLINKTAFLHQISAIYPDDTFLVSYPKSGNTWMRYILSYLIKSTAVELNDKDINQIIPDVYIDKEIIDKKKSNRFIKSHDLFFEDYPKIIYIYRDYRDVLVSYYHFCKSLGQYNESLSTFIKSPIVLRHGSWVQHLEKVFSKQEKHPEKIHLIKYENALINFDEEILKLMRFLKIEPNKIDLEKLKKLTSFEKLKTTENKYGGRFKDVTKTNFFRKGVSGDWKTELSKEDLNYLYQDDKVVFYLKKLGYEI
jgi:hypothetical protein